ncbi:hypothetical protein MHU86_9088 [Fragilaria crotonensis]|nr:hypothetical protein MHU86_9088 [Fragilaria crotonensis]
MHSRTLEVGDTQTFKFSSVNNGPFWMEHAERELNRHDRILPSAPGPSRMQSKTISELKAELAPFDVLNDRQNYRLVELQEHARNKGIETKVLRIREKKGWEGRPKGLLQVLWERGWIDEAQHDKYTMDVATDGDGEALEGAQDWSLKYLMASCLDFGEEMTALQHVGSQLDAKVSCRIGRGRS